MSPNVKISKSSLIFTILNAVVDDPWSGLLYQGVHCRDIGTIVWNPVVQIAQDKDN